MTLLCDRCALLFHTLTIEGFENSTDGCGCMKPGCGCRKKREEDK